MGICELHYWSEDAEMKNMFGQGPVIPGLKTPSEFDPQVLFTKGSFRVRNRSSMEIIPGLMVSVDQVIATIMAVCYILDLTFTAAYDQVLVFPSTVSGDPGLYLYLP